MRIASLQDSLVECFNPTFDLSGTCLCHPWRSLEIVLQTGFELVEKVESALRRQLECLRDDRTNSAVVCGTHEGSPLWHEVYVEAYSSMVTANVSSGSLERYKPGVEWQAGSAADPESPGFRRGL